MLLTIFVRSMCIVCKYDIENCGLLLCGFLMCARITWWGIQARGSWHGGKMFHVGCVRLHWKKVVEKFTSRVTLYYMKVKEIIKVIEADGWYLVTTRGSHRQYKHSNMSGRVTIAGKLSDDLAPGTENSIFKQAQIKKRENN